MRSLLLPVFSAAGRLLLIVLPLLSALPVLAQTNVRIEVNVTYLKWDLPRVDGDAEPAFTMFHTGYNMNNLFFCQTYKERGKMREKW
jgi:hypothetical protein